MSSRRKGPSIGTIIAILGLISTVFGIIGVGLVDLLGGDDVATESEIVTTLIALERDKLSAEFQLTGFALEAQQAANVSTQQAVAEQGAIIQATVNAAQAEQDALLATQNAVSAQTATVDAANAIATQVALDAEATANFLAQLTPTPTITPTATPPPAIVGDHRLIDRALVGFSDKELLFVVRTAQPIPKEPQEGLSYVWALDTDHDSETGVKLEDIGVDSRVTVTFAEGAWLGEVVSVKQDGTLGETFFFFEIDVDGPNLVATLDPKKLGLESTFDWIARVQIGEQTFQPFFPDSGHATLS